MATVTYNYVGLVLLYTKAGKKTCDTFLDQYFSTDYIQHIGSALASLSPCSIPQRIYRQAQSLLRSFLPWSGISSKSGIEYSRTM